MNSSSSQRSTQIRHLALVVDDDPVVQTLLEQFFKKLQFDLICISKGKECVSAIENYKPQIIFLDLMLSDCTGFDVLKELQQLEKVKDIPVILMTATTDGKNIAKLNGVEPTGYLTKPFEFKDLSGLLNTFFNHITKK